jgi:hypothetical protein
MWGLNLRYISTSKQRRHSPTKGTMQGKVAPKPAGNFDRERVRSVLEL